MTLTRRGKIVIGALTAVLVLGTAVAVLALTGMAKHIPGIKNIAGGKETDARPSKCLTGTGKAPDRPALAIKIENLPEARPQAGLNRADIVYEEPVEGGITRFIAVFQCQDAKRVGPVRSARFTDPPILLQFGKDTLFGFAGAAGPVRKAVDKAGLHDLSYDRPDSASAYMRDPNRSAPHNLYTNTRALYEGGDVSDARPRHVFNYGKISGRAKGVNVVHLDFSATADVFWHWSAKHEDWLRFHGTVPHTLEGGVQVSAANVVVMLVTMRDTGLVDAAGNPSPEAETLGHGKAFVFRDGKMIVGRWLRKSPDSVIRFTDKKNHTIRLERGRTWVELFPKDKAIETS